MAKTTISVTDRLADELYERKGRGESYEDVIWLALKALDAESDSDSDRETDHDDDSPRIDLQSTDGGARLAPNPPAATATFTPNEAAAEIIDHPAFEQSVPSDLDREAFAAAVYAAHEFLVANGEAQKTDFVREVMPAHSLKYDADAALDQLAAEDRYRGKWWRLIRDGLKTRPGVVAPDNNAEPWRYTGE